MFFSKANISKIIHNNEVAFTIDEAKESTPTMYNAVVSTLSFEAIATVTNTAPRTKRKIEETNPETLHNFKFMRRTLNFFSYTLFLEFIDIIFML